MTRKGTRCTNYTLDITIAHLQGVHAATTTAATATPADAALAVHPVAAAALPVRVVVTPSVVVGMMVSAGRSGSAAGEAVGVVDGGELWVVSAVLVAPPSVGAAAAVHVAGRGRRRCLLLVHGVNHAHAAMAARVVVAAVVASGTVVGS